MSGNRKLSFDINLFDNEHIAQYALSSEPLLNTASENSSALLLGGEHGSALDHLNALGAGSIASELDHGSKATVNEGERRMLLGLGGRDRLESWGGMSDLSLKDDQMSDMLGASAVLTELANDVCNVVASLDIPSPLDSPRIDATSCPDTPPLAPLSSNPADINALVANVVASLNQEVKLSSLDMGVTAALQAQENLLAESKISTARPACAPTPPTKRKFKPKPAVNPSNLLPPASSKGQSNQKWEEMFAALTEYIQHQQNQTNDTWDGNVPTHFKTNDGKALGRWVGNQRAAKHKGLLKPDRQKRLESTGLKWTVLSTNAWTDMMQELRIYVMEKTKNGQVWNGNVPTNYKIKSNTAPDGTEIDEEKNLGRWINRQRSLYQCGRLKKERQRELEKIGLKWSVLSTSTWENMYEALCQYITIRKNETTGWDGNVPANYKTNDIPTKNLGRWVNRQRSAYAQNRLCKAHEDKLLAIGLKLVVVDKKIASSAQDSDDEDNDCTSSSSAAVKLHGNQLVTSTTNIVNQVSTTSNQNNTIVPNHVPSIPDNVISLPLALENNQVHINKKIKM